MKDPFREKMKDPFISHTLVKLSEATELKKDRKKGGLKELLSLLDAIYSLQEAIEDCIDSGANGSDKLKEFDKHVDDMLEEVVKLTSDGIKGIRTREDGSEIGEDVKSAPEPEETTPEKAGIQLNDIPLPGSIRNTTAPTAPFTPKSI